MFRGPKSGVTGVQDAGVHCGYGSGLTECEGSGSCRTWGQWRDSGGVEGSECSNMLSFGGVRECGGYHEGAGRM